MWLARWSESIASIKVEAAFNILNNFLHIHFWEIFEGVADGDSWIYKSEVGLLGVVEGGVGAILFLASGHTLEAELGVDVLDSSDHGEDVDG